VTPVKCSPTYETEQKLAFEKLVGSAYGRDLALQNVHELKTVTALSDYFGMLRSFSINLTDTLFANPSIKPNENNCLELLEVALKLRHKILYKDV
jgi:hypothetical protein